MKRKFTCFVEMPFGLPKSESYRKMLRAFAGRLEPFEVDFWFVDELAMADLSILRSMVHHAETADFVLALFDGDNKNVIFEMGMAYGLRRPIFLVLLGEHRALPSSMLGQFWVSLHPDDVDGSVIAHGLRSFLDGLARQTPFGPDTRLFLCHRSTDKEQVDPIASYVRGMGCDVWYDSWSIRAGDSIPGRIAEGLDRSTHFAVFLSQNTRDSRWVTKELGTAVSLALARGRPRIIPAFLDETGRRDVPTLLHEIRGIAFYERSRESAMKELVEALREGDA